VGGSLGSGSRITALFLLLIDCKHLHRVSDLWTHGEHEKARAGQHDPNWRRSIRTKGMNGLWQAVSEYVEAQHPPHKKECDGRNYDVANPLSNGLWLGAIGHGQRIALGLKPSAVRQKRNLF
jgi:hypothetical protein